MKTCYVERRFSKRSEKLIQIANEIIEEYQGQGYELTLRQLYYQFVSRDIIPNSQKEYKNLGSVVNDARLAGLVDWDAIVDRTRNLQGNVHWESPAEMLEYRTKSYQIDKWEGQKYRPEVWIEKDALLGVIEGVCRGQDVSYFSCRGYTSQSEMHSAAKRMERYSEDGQIPVVVHLGDHDPSGKDMSRDIQDRLDLFTEPGIIKVVRVALNMSQIKEYKPPPNPAKITDSRSGPYIAEFGKSSWELDALDPKVLSDLVEKTVGGYRDLDLWRKKTLIEKAHKAMLEKAAKKMKSPSTPDTEKGAE